MGFTKLCQKPVKIIEMYKMLLKQNISYFSGTGTEDFSLLISENDFINFLPVSQNMNYLHLDSNSTCNRLGLHTQNLYFDRCRITQPTNVPTKFDIILVDFEVI